MTTAKPLYLNKLFIQTQACGGSTLTLTKDVWLDWLRCPSGAWETSLHAVPQETRVQSSQLFKLLGADPWPKSKGVELVHVSWPDLSDIPPWSSRTWKSNTPASMEIYERRSSLHVWVNMKTNDGIVSEAALGNPLRDGVEHAWVSQSAKIPSWAEKNWTLSSASKDN